MVFSILFIPGRADAYPGGLLDGKPTYYSFCACYVTTVTDNDPATGQGIRFGNHAVSWTLDEPMDIYEYRFQKSAMNVRVDMWNDMGVLVYRATESANGAITRTVDVKSVTRIAVANPGSTGGTLWEFDAYGYFNYPVPKGLTATSDTRKISLNWSYTPYDNFVGYNVYMDGVLVNSSPIKTNNYAFTLAPDIPHTFSYTAVYDSGGNNVETRHSSEVTAFAYDTPLKKPVITGLEWETEIKLSWLPIEGATNYQLFTDSGQLLYSGMETTFDHKGLTLNSDHTYYLEVIDKYDRRVRSELVTFRAREPPPPVNLQFTLLNKRHDQMQVRWTATNPPYLITLNGLSKGTTSNNLFTFDGLEPETSYVIQVTYIDGYGRTVNSLVTYKTDPLPQPVSPVLSYLALMHNEVRLSWTNVGTSYRIYQDGVLLETTNSQFKQLTGLTPATAYQFQVIAFDRWGRENPSNILNLVTKPEPPPPKPPGPTTPPPPVSTSNNEDLNKVNDQLVQGAHDTKDSGMIVILVILLIFILIFGIWWLIRIFKKKMLSTSTNHTGSGGSVAASARTSLSSSPKRQMSSRSSTGSAIRSNTVNKTYSRSSSISGQKRPKQISGQRAEGRKPYYVEKNLFRKKKH